MTIEIKGATALITGANRGIGAALVDALIAAGAAKIYAGMRTPAPSRDPRIVPIALDVTDDARIAEVAREAGDVQILINNAGVVQPQSLLAVQSDVEMRVNYFGMLAMSRAFAPVLARNGGGAVVNLLSIVSRVNAPRIGSYSASKAAAWSATQWLRAELAPQGTHVLGVMPGFIDTDMARAVTLPKMPPAALAAAVLDALRAGAEDLYPGDAAEVERALLLDAKAVERQFASDLPPLPRPV